jgi:hypothetical protein
VNSRLSRLTPNIRLLCGSLQKPPYEKYPYADELQDTPTCVIFGRCDKPQPHESAKNRHQATEDRHKLSGPHNPSRTFLCSHRSASRRSVGIDAALDLGQAFVVAVNHCCDGDRAAYDDGNDRNQERAQAYDGIEDSIDSPPPD